MRRAQDTSNGRFREIHEEASAAEAPADYEDREHAEGMAELGEAKPLPSRQRSGTDSPASRASRPLSPRSRTRARAGASPSILSRSGALSQHRGTPTRRSPAEAGQLAGRPAVGRRHEDGIEEEFPPTQELFP